MFNLYKLFFLILLICAVSTNFAQTASAKKAPPDPAFEEIVPDGDYRFVKYNDLPGEIELNLFEVKKAGQLNTAHIISPDFKKMAYSQVYFYPSLNRTASEIYVIPLDEKLPPIQRVQEASIKDKIVVPLLSQGLKDTETQVFRTLIPIDWSYDASKLLIKSRIGEVQRDLWECDLWVYDFDEAKAYDFPKLRKAIRNDYLKRFKVNLSGYHWDIQPIGWDILRHDRIIVYIYGYKTNKYRTFLGAWSIDYKTGDILFLSNEKNTYEIGQYGYKLKRFDN